MTARDDIEDSKLVSALNNDDVKAFDALFRRYGKQLYSFVFGYLKLEAESEDIVQEVFIKIWNSRKQLNRELSFKAYIFKIAYHLVLDEFEDINRRQQYYREIIDESIDFTDDLDERLNYSMLLEKVDSFINQLPQRQKEVLIKRRKEGFSIKEIASQMGISPKTVENHLTEALKTIKRNFGKINY